MVHMVIHARDLRIPEAQAVSLLSVTAATSINGRISAGVVADRLGIRWTIGIGLGASLIAFVWLLFADRLWMLYVFAVIYGYGGWAVGAVISPVVAEFFGFKSHGVILGAVNAAGTLGGAVGPLIAGAIYDRMKNYDRAFITCAAVSGICLILLAFLRKTPEGGKT
jgi:MFS family permease